MATKTATKTAFDVKQLPTTGVQYRLTAGGTGTPQATAYKQAMRTLAAWAKPNGASPLVHALVHLGWCSGSGARATCQAAKSAAFTNGQAHLQVGAPAAPQVVSVLGQLASAGAPQDTLAVVWATYTGTAKA